MPLCDSTIEAYAFFLKSLNEAVLIGKSTSNLPITEHMSAMKSMAHHLRWTVVNECAFGYGSGILIRSPKHKKFDFCPQVSFRTSMAASSPRTEMVMFQLKIRSHGGVFEQESHPANPSIRLCPYVTFLPSQVPELSLCQCFGTTFIPTACHARSLWFPKQLSSLECSACIAMIRVFREIGRRKLIVPIAYM